MTLREAVIKEIEGLSEEALEGVLEYIKFMKEPPEVEATEEELEAIARGRDEYERGEYVRWRDIKTDAV
jgi:hypothetical protein